MIFEYVSFAALTMKIEIIETWNSNSTLREISTWYVMQLPILQNLRLEL